MGHTHINNKYVLLFLFARMNKLQLSTPVHMRVARNFKRGVLFKINRQNRTHQINYFKYTLITPRGGVTKPITSPLAARLSVHYTGIIRYVNNYAVYLLFVNSYLFISKKL